MKKASLSKLSKKVLIQESVIFGIIAVFVVQTYFLMQINPNNKTGWFHDYYWIIFGALLVVLLGYFIYGFIRSLKEKRCLPVKFADESIKYGFLLKQLVVRDFKRKYKRSLLGVLWSFLNPLLMMGVQYVVFSTIFGNENIKCYPVYLLIGVVMFAVVNESCGCGLSAITDNASLIKKVSVPSYIFTLSRVIMAFINFALSLIPLIIVMAACKIIPAASMLFFFPVVVLLFFFVFGIALFLSATMVLLKSLLIFFFLGCLVLFSLGVGMFLSALMVFFRDIQFLWGVFNMLWMYGTPIFYDINSIGNPTFQTVIKCNPLYHYLTFIRTAFIDGTCPDIKSLGFCLLFSVIAFALGALVFGKTKKRFSFYV